MYTFCKLPVSPFVAKQTNLFPHFPLLLKYLFSHPRHIPPEILERVCEICRPLESFVWPVPATNQVQLWRTLLYIIRFINNLAP